MIPQPWVDVIDIAVQVVLLACILATALIVVVGLIWHYDRSEHVAAPPRREALDARTPAARDDRGAAASTMPGLPAPRGARAHLAGRAPRAGEPGRGDGRRERRPDARMVPVVPTPLQPGRRGQARRADDEREARGDVAGSVRAARVVSERSA